MTISRFAVLVALACLLTPLASATTVTATSYIPGSLYNDANGGWGLVYDSAVGGPAPRLESATFTLLGAHHFDTSSFLNLTSLQFTLLSGGVATGIDLPVIVGDNDTSFSMTFSLPDYFNPGDTLRWGLDIDGESLPGPDSCDDFFLSDVLCLASHLQNNVGVDLTFGGPGFDSRTLSFTLDSIVNADRGPGGAINYAQGSVTGEIVPEPGTFALLGGGLLGLGLIARRFRR